MSRPTLDPARRLGISDTRLSLSPAGLPSPFSYLTSATTQSEPRDARITVWALSISLAATLEIDKFSFSSSGYLDVSVPRVPHVQLCIHCTLTEVSSAGFPHSDISGSLDMCSSPKLFAAYHVFHRLPVPRHSPCALVRLTFQTFFQNIWYPLDSLLLPTKIIVTLPFEIAIFLKRTYYNLCFAVIIQFSRYVLVMFLKARSPETLIFITWWAKMDSNHRPHDYQSCALAS